MKSVALDLTCPCCAGELDPVAKDDPKGWMTRERRLVVACRKQHCAWVGVIVTELIDLNRRRTA